MGNKDLETNREKAPVHFMVPFPRNEGFIGTSRTLEWFKEADAMQGSQLYGHRRIGVCGLGGVGYVS